MEHFRRPGFAQDICALGLPPDHPTDIAYFTRFAQRELARIRLPTAAQAIQQIKSMTGSWSAAELPHRVSQKFVEQVLRRHAHLFTPTGGLGYNTAAEDAVNLGWKLASAVRSEPAPALLDSYEAARKPLAERNTRYARQFADSVGLFAAKPELEEDSPDGERERQHASHYLDAHARLEFNIPGVTFGGRYDASPLIADDGTAAPPDTSNTYVPTAKPGGRPPHLWLEDGRSLFDLFHAEWTLLALGPSPPSTAAFEEAARSLGIDLRVLPLAQPALLALYEAPLVLIRPDQVVGWRGGAVEEALRVLARVGGR